MKFIYTAALALLFHLTSTATTWTVAVSNFEFSPSAVNAVVGDVIHFTWSNGGHTTTCGAGLPGTALPAGAAEWNSAMNSSVTTFDYTVTVPGDYLYGCIPHWDGGNGMKGTITVSGPLPVKLSAFNVSSSNKSSTLVQWQTASESNAAYFSVRKSTDGTHFSEIGRVKAAGNSSQVLNYTFQDGDLGALYKYLYYAIAIVDIDKKESLSPIKTIRNAGNIKDNLIVSLSPNPITRPAQVQLKFNADKTGEMDVSVYNNSGQEVLKTKMTAFYGLNTAHLHVCDLQKGNYNIVFTLDGKKETRTIAVL